MSESPKPSSLARTFLIASLYVLAGAWALQLAFQLLRSIAPLIIGVLIITAVAALIRLIRRNRSDRSW